MSTSPSSTSSRRPASRCGSASKSRVCRRSSTSASSPAANTTSSRPRTGSPRCSRSSAARCSSGACPRDPAHDSLRGGECLGRSSNVELRRTQLRGSTPETGKCPAGVPPKALPHPADQLHRPGDDAAMKPTPGPTRASSAERQRRSPTTTPNRPIPQGFTGCGKLGFKPEAGSQADLRLGRDRHRHGRQRRLQRRRPEEPRGPGPVGRPRKPSSRCPRG